MRKAAFSCLVLALAAVAFPAAAHRPPVIVELYTAQGCEACNEANAQIDDMAEREGVLPLTFSVDYWDYLGWTDTLARPEFTDRQKAYAKRLGPREVYTPQVVIDGRKQVVGGKEEDVEDAVRDALNSPRNPPDMLFQLNGKIAVGSGPVPRGGAEVWLVRYDPERVETEVKKGDNRGETIVARNAVRQLKRLGRWRGRPTAFRLPAAEEEGLDTLVIVQQTHGGRIVAALKKPKPKP
ncbi:MAG TPA: DUF1223 domain-containing protein [Caulobacteraceae bacterium]